MKQYNEIKARHPGALLLFRVGDFYETFGEDAVTASRILDIVLTKRSNGSASEVELAGFPHHAMDTYLPKLVRAGQRVAICDQLEDPKAAKGIVKRGVTELVTPGLSLNDHVLDKRSNNFLASVSFGADKMGIAFLDLSTGEFQSTEGSPGYMQKLVQSFDPSEIIYPKGSRSRFHELFGDEYLSYVLDDWIFAHDFGYEKLIRHFQTSSLKGFGIEEMTEAVIAAGAAMYYLEETEHRQREHITRIGRIEEEKYVWLDKFTIRNLELLYAQHQGGIPLLDIMDDTITPMGSRLLKKWIVLPLRDLDEIRKRHRAVEAFVKDRDTTDEVRTHLKKISDLERLIGKVAVGRANPREMVAMKNSLGILVPIAECIRHSTSGELADIVSRIRDCSELVERISSELKDEVPLQTHSGGLIRDGIDPELDRLRKIAFSGKDYLVEIQQSEARRTGISSLKIAYNKVFGYYLEVSNTHKDKVPAEWIRKQTLVNAERYITEELKKYEEEILHAEEQLIAIEQKRFGALIAFASGFIDQVQENARLIAELDCLMSFAGTAVRNKYCRPEVNDGLAIRIEAGRHPVIERQLPPGESYVPNDLYLENGEQQVIIITGPNMAGKSAFLRQTALITLMAQMGSFVPARKAIIGLVDKVFTRVGASDNLSRGESTFMVEMTETASILNNLSERSLILMDEIGRGTSTYDGVSIAWAIVEYLNTRTPAKPKTLFATHYHELNQLAEELGAVVNYNVSVKEVGDRVIFLRTLKPGGSEHSFGIHVAQMAGMPNQVVIRASEIMHFLEEDRRAAGNRKSKVPGRVASQLSIFESDEKFIKLRRELMDLDINTISPVEALLKLNELKNLMDAGKGKDSVD